MRGLSSLSFFLCCVRRFGHGGVWRDFFLPPVSREGLTGREATRDVSYDGEEDQLSLLLQARLSLSLSFEASSAHSQESPFSQGPSVCWRPWALLVAKGKIETYVGDISIFHCHFRYNPQMTIGVYILYLQNLHACSQYCMHKQQLKPCHVP